MINVLIDASIRDRFLVLLAVIVIAIGGIWSFKNMPLDAIPDLSDVQVIVFTEYPGQAPQLVEDQVTYPLTTALLAVPKAKVVRGYSFFGLSFVYVIFEDGTDIYWARSRVLEYLNYVSGRLPSGINPTLGPWGRTPPVLDGFLNMHWWTKPENTTWLNYVPSRTGICVIRCKPYRAFRRWLPSVDTSSNIRLKSIPMLCTRTIYPYRK